MPVTEISDKEKQTCREIAFESIQQGLETGSALSVNVNQYTGILTEKAATFVTLELNGQLRGCIGTLNAYQPLIADVAEHAFAAAFRDPRFSALTPEEAEQVVIKISVLTDPEPVDFSDENDLLHQIQKDNDGLILEFQGNKGTFLPSVWEQIDNEKEFLEHLKLKAGLPMNWWDNDVRISRYYTISF